MVDGNPLYNLKAVCKETGLSPATLRAWERRYGLVIPKRSPGGHRLYSRHDVELLKWLMERKQEGLSISRAVEMWRQSSQGEHTQFPNTSHLVSGTTESMIGELRDQWISACLALDDQTANQILQQAFAIALPEIISMQVLQKGLSQIGEHWYAGSATVQQEHFASAIAIRHLDTLINSCAVPTRSETILVACPPEEEHDFILLLINYLLRRNGWNVLYLGANVPLNELDTTIKSTNTSLVVSAAQTLSAAASLCKMSEYLREQGVLLAYGGGIFQQISEITRQISGYYLGDDIASVPRQVEILVIDHPKIPLANPVSDEYTQTLAEYIHNEDAINAFVSSSIPAQVIRPAFLEIAISNFSSLIASALYLGNIHFMESSITWLEGLLTNYDQDRSETRRFFNRYRTAVEHFLGESGGIILDWFSTIES
jgi:DNA-binding transcriptional MerR regulator